MMAREGNLSGKCQRAMVDMIQAYDKEGRVIHECRLHDDEPACDQLSGTVRDVDNAIKVFENACGIEKIAGFTKEKGGK